MGVQVQKSKLLIVLTVAEFILRQSGAGFGERAEVTLTRPIEKGYSYPDLQV
jgi:hypothetical protein